MNTAEQNPPYRNPDLPIETRIDDLLGRMSLEEKARQLDQYHGCASFAERTFPTHHTAMDKGSRLDLAKVETVVGDSGIGSIHDLYPPDAEPINQLQRQAVEDTRLGIPILFAEEALHGLCGPGNTIFPQAIGLAGSWNTELVERVGQAIARELRAYGIHESFGPVLDLARDPRWGRMEETYGEDTHLAARMAVAMVRGMQGGDLSADDSIIAEPKHFAAYGDTRGGLNTSSNHLGKRDLLTYYLPVFEAAVTEGGAMGMMCSYNSIDGIPCPADHWLLTEVLREQWGFQGYVRSDLGAVRRLRDDHRTAADAEDCIRQTLEAGLDIQYYDFDNDTWQGGIVALVRDGRLAMETVDRAVRRVLRAKFMLGLFEQPHTDPKLVKERVRCQAHIDLAREAARQSICLMKNEGSLLPLRKDLARIAVIGPNASEVRSGDYAPTIWGFEPVSVLAGIRAAVSPGTEVVYAKGTDVRPGGLDAVPPANLRSPEGEPGLRAEYYNSLDLAGKPVLRRNDPNVDFNWIFTKPANEVDHAAFSVRWTGTLTAGHSFEGYLGTSSLDSMRLWVDGVLVVDGWDKGKSANTNLSVPFSLEAGQVYDLRIEYKKDNSGIQVCFGWNQGDDDIAAAVDAARQADVAILCVGDSRDTCGEGRDRSQLDLPGRQGDLVKAIHATGTPCVLLLQIGRALALPWEAEHIPAILNAWFPAEQGGTAVAEVLFGDRNPAGRLPVTFPKSIGQLPLYYNALPFGNKTYIDCGADALFSFGHGLSYTDFAYSGLEVSPKQTGPRGTVTVQVDVTNTGERAGDEVVQLYLNDVVSSVVRPLKELKGFQRLHLEAGAAQTVRFELGPKDLALLDRHLAWSVEAGEFEVTVGGSSAAALSARFEVVPR